MTWTAILYNGKTYHRQIFYGSHDSQDALKEAREKFVWLFPAAVNVVAIVPGEHPVVFIDKPG